MTGRLYERFRKVAADRADTRALTFLDARSGSTSYTYDALFEAVERLSVRLGNLDLPIDRPVGILLRTQQDQVLHYLAALHVGLVPAILTPPNRKLNTGYYIDTMSSVFDRSGFGALVTDVDGFELETMTLAPHTFEMTGGRGGSAPAASVPREASFLQFSSGTTGFKKGVLVPDRAVLDQIDTYASALGLSEEDVILSWLPLYHDMGFIACLNLPLAAGVPTVMLDPIDWVTDPVTFLRAASEHGATLAWNPNFAYAFMAQRIPDRQLDGIDLSTLRGLVNCSEPATVESQNAFLDRFAPLGLRSDVFRGCYAMAETTFALTHGDPEDPGYIDLVGPTDGTWSRPEGNVSVGRPLPGVEIRIVDEHGNNLPDRVVGEIWARSPFNLSGYYNDPEATSTAIRDGWYHTGDLGYRVGDALYVPGRKKDVLIVGGVNVFPQDIEDLVGSHDHIVGGRVSAFSEFDPRMQTERITVLAESELESSHAQQHLVMIRQHLLASFQIANFQVHLVPPGWLIKSSSGKMARSANRDKWQQGGS